MAAFWPTSTHDYARPMNEIPKVVFSRTLERADWLETRIARGDLAEEVGRLKREPGSDLIAYGGATLDQALSRLGLVDEYRLMVQPAALGAGLPLFNESARAATPPARRSDHLRDGRRHPRLPATLESRRPAGRSGPTRTGRLAQRAVVDSQRRQPWCPPGRAPGCSWWRRGGAQLVADELVDEMEQAVTDGLAVDETHGLLAAVLAEEALAGAEDDREYDQSQLVDQVVLD
jgi:dihydrofolate reductase